MTDGPIGLLIQLFSLIVGLPLFALGLWWTWRRWDLRQTGLQATVQVTGYEASEDFDGGTPWQHPVVQFGSQKMILSQGERGTKRWPIGSMLPVRYRPEAPERMIVDRPGSLFFLPVMIALLGIGVLGFAWLV